MRLAGYIALFALSLGVAGYAIFVYGFMPLGAVVQPEMREVFQAERLGIYAHVFGATFALVLGPLQFSTKLRSRYPNAHRWSGRVYLLAGVLVGGIAGLYMAFHAFGGWPARLGFAGLAVAWLYTGYRAYVAIRARDIVSHRRWMTRNFALTFAAVMLRLWLPSAMVAGLPAVLSYQVIAWLCWIPNLIVAELLINRSPYMGSPALAQDLSR